MNKEVSIVLSRERRSHRQISQEWYGLTDEQMVGMDVHHNPPRSLGGRNIPEHLYVYHNTLHSAVHEHNFVLWSRAGTQAAHREKDELGRSVCAVKAAKAAHEERDELGRSITAVKAAAARNLDLHNAHLHQEKDKQGRSSHAVKMNEKAHAEKDGFGKSLKGIKDGQRLNSQKWEDPDHPELGSHNAGNLVKVQRAHGYPHGPENRRKVTNPLPVL